MGFVSLVGAGPGDVELITVKGLKALQRAEVVLFDRLSNPELLAECRGDALLFDVGKARGECGRPRQEAINALLIEFARQGKRVVRLKGGDPFVFGRGGEEILALREAGIPYDIVPGVSSAIAAASAAEIPVTHRSLSTGFAVFTAQGASDVDTVPWATVATVPTLVLLMGVERLPQIVHRLLESGRAASTPIAVISKATRADQKAAIGTLESIVSEAQGIESPATIVVGEVVRLGLGAASRTRSASGSRRHPVAGAF